MTIQERKLRAQRKRAAISYKILEQQFDNPPIGHVFKKSRYGAQLTAQPMERAEEDHIKSNLKGMTTRGSGRKPSMPKMPWTDDDKTSKD